MSHLPIVAVMYDFDRTLCTKDMQDYSFIPSLGMTESEFWQFTNEMGNREHMDSVLAYMYAMVKISRDKNIPLRRESLVDMGKNVELFRGVEQWFDRITRYGLENGVQIEQYVISSGMKEIIEGTSISRCFKSIFACEFLYDENGGAVLDFMLEVVNPSGEDSIDEINADVNVDAYDILGRKVVKPAKGNILIVNGKTTKL